MVKTRLCSVVLSDIKISKMPFTRHSRAELIDPPKQAKKSRSRSKTRKQSKSPEKRKSSKSPARDKKSRSKTRKASKSPSRRASSRSPGRTTRNIKGEGDVGKDVVIVKHQEMTAVETFQRVIQSQNQVVEKEVEVTAKLLAGKGDQLDGIMGVNSAVRRCYLFAKNLIRSEVALAIVVLCMLVIMSSYIVEFWMTLRKK